MNGGCCCCEIVISLYLDVCAVDGTPAGNYVGLFVILVTVIKALCCSYRIS